MAWSDFRDLDELQPGDVIEVGDPIKQFCFGSGMWHYGYIDEISVDEYIDGTMSENASLEIDYRFDVPDQVEHEYRERAKEWAKR